MDHFTLVGFDVIQIRAKAGLKLPVCAQRVTGVH